MDLIQKLTDEIIQKLTDEIVRKPTADLFYRRGRVYLNVGKYNLAIQDCENGLKVDPKHTKCYILHIYALCRLKRYDDALEVCKKTIGTNSDFSPAYCGKGNIYLDLDRYDEALQEYNKATELDPTDAFPYNGRGTVYRKLNQYNEAIQEYNKATELDPTYDMPYYNRGNVYRDLKHYDKALQEYNKATELDPTYAMPHYNRGNIYYDRNQFSESLVNYKKAYALFKERDEYYKSVAISRINELNLLITSPKEPKDKTAVIIEKTEEFANTIEENKKRITGFYSHKQPVKSVDSLLFTVLRKWNSFTPIISGGFRSGKGGGYFVQSGKTGIVIDPGFNFIENFFTDGHTFKEIDAVLITHAHNDHTADLDSLLTILYEYNYELYGGDLSDPYCKVKEGSILEDVLKHFNFGEDMIRNDKEKKRQVQDEMDQRFPNEAKKITFYITNGTSKKYNNFFDLMKRSNYKVVPVDAENAKNFAIGDINIHVIEANHNDIMSDHASVGFCFEQDDFALIYTGDTSFLGMSTKYNELSNHYIGKKIVLIANIGGFINSERDYLSGGDREEYYYKKHLGRLGLAKLVEILKPELCIISEFGEEFTGYRHKIAEIFDEVYGETLKTKFLPADIGLHVKCKKGSIQVWAHNSSTDLTDSDFIDPLNVRVGEVNQINQLYYYSKDVKSEIELAKKKVSEFYKDLAAHA